MLLWGGMAPEHGEGVDMQGAPTKLLSAMASRNFNGFNETQPCSQNYYFCQIKLVSRVLRRYYTLSVIALLLSVL